jgi:putative alpha-1,2-mannosidase
VLFDVGRDNDRSSLVGDWHVADPRTVTGSVDVPGSGGITIWFAARFDRPFTAHGSWSGSTLTPGANDAHGAGAGGWVSFDTTTDQKVGVRGGLSYVDAAGALGNLTAEAPDGTSFDSVRQQA